MLATCKPTPYCLLVSSCSQVCCATWSIFRHMSLVVRATLSLSAVKNGYYGSKVLMRCSPLLRLADSAPLFIRRSLRLSCDPRSLARLVLLLPIRHAAGDRSPLSPSVYLGDPFKPLDLTSALAGAPVRREQRCALLYAAGVPTSQIMSIAAEVTREVWP